MLNSKILPIKVKKSKEGLIYICTKQGGGERMFFMKQSLEWGGVGKKEACTHCTCSTKGSLGTGAGAYPASAPTRGES